MADVVLLVFEGRKTEPAILRNLVTHYFNNEQSAIIQATFDTDIYQLWKKVEEDEYLDLLEIVRELTAENKKELAGISREDVSQIFLFFDYDGHSNYASDVAIESMLAHFNDESNEGKLYISYPMVEAFKHIKRDTDFGATTFEIYKGTEYKEQVHSSTDFQDIRKLERSHWDYIVVENYKKANLIVHGTYEEPDFNNCAKNLKQEHIFEGQLKSYIAPNGVVAVLSAFPFFIVEYFGENAINPV